MKGKRLVFSSKTKHAQSAFTRAKSTSYRKINGKISKNSTCWCSARRYDEKAQFYQPFETPSKLILSTKHTSSLSFRCSFFILLKRKPFSWNLFLRLNYDLFCLINFDVRNLKANFIFSKYSTKEKAAGTEIMKSFILKIRMRLK